MSIYYKDYVSLSFWDNRKGIWSGRDWNNPEKKELRKIAIIIKLIFLTPKLLLKITSLIGFKNLAHRYLNFFITSCFKKNFCWQIASYTIKYLLLGSLKKEQALTAFRNSLSALKIYNSRHVYCRFSIIGYQMSYVKRRILHKTDYFKIPLKHWYL